ncbi:hypothetical protein JCM10213_006716 [Rhodosporidiobolus nylandii]
MQPVHAPGGLQPPPQPCVLLSRPVEKGTAELAPLPPADSSAAMQEELNQQRATNVRLGGAESKEKELPVAPRSSIPTNHFFDFAPASSVRAAPSSDLDPEDDELKSDERRTILFTSTATFRTAETFLSSCTAALQSSFGYRACRDRNTPTVVSVRCQRRLSDSCRFQVTAKRQKEDEPYRLDEAATRWYHSHGSAFTKEEDEASESDEGSGTDTDDGLGVGEIARSAADQPDVKQVKRGRPQVGWETTWTASTKSAAMLDLLKKRETIFALQRKLDIPALQARSRAAADKYIKSHHTPSSVPLAAYSRFCASVKVPPFPLTPAMCALAFYTKCSAKNGPYYTFRSELERLRKVTTTGVWADEAIYQKLLALDPEGLAFDEFGSERVAKQAGSTSANGTDGTASTSAIKKRKASDHREIANSSTSSGRKKRKLDLEPVEEKKAKPTIVSAAGVEQLECPGFPQPDSTFFPTREALYSALVTSIVPVYGIGVAFISKDESTAKIHCNRSHGHYATRPGGVCPFLVSAHKSKGADAWSINGDKSTLLHNHGADERLLADPSWRPTVKNPEAKKALELLSLASKRLSKSPPDDQQPSGGPPSTAFPERPVAPVAPASFSAVLPTTSAPFAAPAAPHLARPLHPHAPLSDLSAFLAGLHPRLQPLAPSLAAAGIDSRDSLVRLTLMTPSLLEALLADMQEPSGFSGPGVDGALLQLLVEKLQEGRAAGWAR